MNSIDVLVELSYMASGNLNIKLGEKNEIQKATVDINGYIKEEYLNFKENIKDDGYFSILTKIIEHKYSSVILGLLDSIFLTSKIGKSSNIAYLVYKDTPSEQVYESLYLQTPEQNIALFERVIKDAETFMETQTPNISRMVVKTLDTSRINLPELIATKMTAAAAGGKMNL